MKNDINDKKKIKFIIIIVLLFIIYIVFALFFVNLKSNDSVNYLIIGDSLIWQEDGGKWYQLNNYSDKMKNNNYWVYNGNNILKAQNIQYRNYKWYFFDENYNQINNDDFRLAYSGKKKMKVANYQEMGYEPKDEAIIESVIKINDEEIMDLYRKSLKKIEYDFDDDGTIETIYSFSSYILDVLNYDPKNYLVLTKNNKVIDTIETDKDNILNFVEILDINFDAQYEMVMSKGVINLPTFDSCYQIYMIDDDKLVEIQDCLYVE